MEYAGVDPTRDLTAVNFKINGDNEVFINKSLIGNKPGMLLIWAKWCGHCIRYKPNYINLARQLGQNFNCMKVEDDVLQGNPQLRECLKYDSYPTIKFFDQNGKIVGTFREERSDNNIKNYICKMYHHCITEH